MGNQWKKIWNNRESKLGTIHLRDKKAVFLEMKRMDGFDIAEDGIPYEELLKQYNNMKCNLRLKSGDHVFEIGCGCGANLYLLYEEGFKVGGLDYSAPLIEAMEKHFSKENLKECICGEAAEVPVEERYHAVFSNSVFSYFPDFQYAEEVLKRMLKKTMGSIGILDIHDEEKKEAFLRYRMENTPDYEERYRDLPKLFYSRKFFEDFAISNHLSIKFSENEMEGYWNNGFVFDCYMYR